MAAIYNLKNKPVFRPISNTWLIVALLIGSLFINSCGTPRSIRSLNGGPITKSALKQSSLEPAEKSVNDTDLSAIKDFENKINNKKNQPEEVKKQPETAAITDNYSSPPVEKRLPTLREQMQGLKEDQTSIKGNVDNLQKDVSDIKISLEEIKDAVRALANIERPLAAKGPSSPADPKANQGSKNLNDENPADNSKVDEVILPEESAPKPKAKQPATIKPPKQAPVKKVSKTSSGNPAVKPISTIASKNIKEKSQSNTKQTFDTKEQNLNIADGFKNAMTSYSKRNYSESISRLSDVVRAAKDPMLIGECNFYIGESHFELRDYIKAIDFFNKVLRSPNRSKQDDAQNKIAECNARTGKIKEARDAYQTLLAKYPQSEFVPMARKMLQQL